MAHDHLRPGNAGGSARQKAKRLREENEALRAGRGRLARLIAPLLPSAQEERLRQEERNWLTGAEGEELLARSLARRCPSVPMLHDRRTPLSLANIDHIAFAPSGIYVIDCKRYTGKIEIDAPLFGKAKLKINGRDRTKLLDGLDNQVAYIKAAVRDVADDVPVHGCLCFVAPSGFLADIGLPAVRTPQINGYPLYYPRRLARRLKRAGLLTAGRAQVLQAELARRLPSALPD